MSAAPIDPPLRVDWLDASELRDGRRGRLGLTVLPGKHGPSLRYPGRVYRRDLAADLETLRDGGWRYLALLVEDHELDRWGDADIVERGAAAGVRIERFPMPDGTAPTDASHMDEILAALATARQEGDAAVACMGGVGRTGTVAACALVAGGWDAEDAIERVRQVRHPTAVETTEQMTFVHRYASNGSSVRRRGLG